LPYVKDQMGHSSIQITADKYIHLLSGRNVRFIDRLDTLKPVQPDATRAQPETEVINQDEVRDTSQMIEEKAWCERGDSNPHPLRDQILSLARLPIPPLSRFDISILLNNLYSQLCPAPFYCAPMCQKACPWDLVRLGTSIGESPQFSP
jgi:hypothetical protein